MGWFDFISDPISSAVSSLGDWGGNLLKDPIGGIGKGALAPFKWTADALSSGGDIAGVNELEGAGDFGKDVLTNPGVEKGAGALTLALAGQGVLGGTGGAGDFGMESWGGGPVSGDLGMESWGGGLAGLDPITGAVAKSSWMDPAVAGFSMTDGLSGWGAPGVTGTAPFADLTAGLDMTPFYGSMDTPGPGAESMFGMGDWWKKLTGTQKLMAGMGGAGLLSNLTSGFMRQGQQNTENQNVANSLSDYFKTTQWTPERRENTMKGVMGQVNQMISGQQRRAGATGADSGRGGGFYGSSVERARQAGREQAASELAKTWAPPNYSPEAFIAQGKANTPAVSPWYDFSQGIGNTAGKWPYLALMDKFLS
jgi:hypothetical protein